MVVAALAGGPAMGKLKSMQELFEGRHFDREVIILCVRWCLRFKLSLRDLVEMMAERGLSMAHTTIMRSPRQPPLQPHRAWGSAGSRPSCPPDQRHDTGSATRLGSS